MNIQVTLVYASAPRQVLEIPLTLAHGATVGQALFACGIETQAPGLNLQDAVVGIWGRKVSPEQVLEENDRVEIYRPLRVNPQTARRERFAAQGSRGTGLFAKKRAGGKAGY